MNIKNITHDWRSHFQRLEGAYAPMRLCAYAPATMRSYRGDVEAFEAWCQENKCNAFPASVDTVCRFLEEQGANNAPSTVRRRLYAIRKVHRLLQLEDPTFHEEINLAFRRIRRGKHERPKQAKGLTREYLKRFLDVQPDNPWGLRNKAMLSLGYDLLTRRSELVALMTNDISWSADGTLRVIIRRSKADPFGQGRIAFGSKRSAYLLEQWLGWRGTDINFLFCPIYQHRAVNRDLSTCTVKRLIKESAKKAGCNPSEVLEFSGHSMRVGAAQDLLSAGHDTAAIMRAGGWKSINVLGRYLEMAEHNVWA